MKRLKTIGAVAIVALLCTAQSLTAFASTNYNKFVDLTEEEAVAQVWEEYVDKTGYESDLEDEEYTDIVQLEVSIEYYELKKFIADYEPANEYVNISEVEDDFFDYMQDMQDDFWYGCTYVVSSDGSIYICVISDDEDAEDCTLTYDESTDTLLCVNDDGEEVIPEEIQLWTYDADSDMYICTDENGKITATYAKYHLYDDDDTTSSSTTATSSSSRSSSGTSGSAKTATAATSAADSEEEIEEYAVSSSTTATAATSSMSTTQIIILAVVGVLVLCGIVVVIVLLVKRNKSDKA